MTDEKEANKVSSFDESSMYEAFEAENFELFKEMQVLNETKIRNKFFFDRISELFAKRFEQEEEKEDHEQFMSKCRTVLGDLIVGTKDFAIGNNISFGASAIVYEGMYKFIKVAIKKLSMCTISIKSLVSL